MPCLVKCLYASTSKYIEDITRWREDVNFMFKWQEQYFTSERSKRVRYCSCDENIKFISLSLRVMFFLLQILMTAVLTIIQGFPTTFRRFPKILQNLPEGHTNVDEHFPKISEDYRRFPEITEDCRRLSRKIPRCFNDTPTNLSTI